MDRELRQETETLYALPPNEFTEARKVRAKELRPENAPLAAEVAKLAKPTAAAAAINRIARDDPSEVRALVQAGRALRSAQESALAGKDAAAVGEATREHRAALDRVRREARRLKLSDAVLERVTSTLRAASVDPELQPLLERGLLAREVESAGFGLDPGLAVAAPPRKPRGGKRAESAARAAKLKAAREELAEAKSAAAAADRERKRLAKELEQAEREVDGARSSSRSADSSPLASRLRSRSASPAARFASASRSRAASSFAARAGDSARLACCFRPRGGTAAARPGSSP